MTQVILLDFWGTLAENGVYSPLRQVKDKLKIDLPFSEYVMRFETTMMLKPLPDLSEAFKLVGEEFGADADEQTIEELVGMWNKNWIMAQPYEEVAETLAELKKEFTLVLVSNTDCFSLPKVLDKFDLRKHFDHFFLSYEVGVLKSEPRFFRAIAKELGLHTSELVMVGDSIQSDIMPAKSAGAKAVLMDRHDKRQYPLKIRSLNELRSLL